MAQENIKAVVGLGIGVAELVDSVADGVSIGDLLKVVGVLKEVKPAIDAIKSGGVLAEYKALDDASRASLNAWFDSEFDLKEDKIEAVVEQAFSVVVQLSELSKLLS